MSHKIEIPQSIAVDKGNINNHNKNIVCKECNISQEKKYLEEPHSNVRSWSFNDINLLAQSNIRGFLQEWLPGGIIRGHEYCPLNPTRDDKHIGSFCINLNTS